MIKVIVDLKAGLIKRIEKYREHLYIHVAPFIKTPSPFDTENEAEEKERRKIIDFIEEEVARIKEEALEVLRKKNLGEASEHAYKRLEELRKRISRKLGIEIPQYDWRCFITGF